MQGQRIGYIRVSSFDQNPDRQLEQIEVGKVFTDKASGKDTQRPELERLLAEHKLKDVRERMADLARMEAVLSDLVCACHARKGNVSCPLIASLQGKKEPRSADAV